MASVEESKLTDELLKECDEFHLQLLRISGIAEDFIAKYGVNALSSEITEHMTALLCFQVMCCREWPAFHDVFVASVIHTRN